MRLACHGDDIRAQPIRQCLLTGRERRERTGIRSAGNGRHPEKCENGQPKNQHYQRERRQLDRDVAGKIDPFDALNSANRKPGSTVSLHPALL
jgi:hypothetical protein